MDNKTPLTERTFGQKPENEFPLITGPAEKIKEKNDTVSVPRSEWNEILLRLKQIEEGGVKKIEKVKERTATIAFYEGKIVTKILKTWVEHKFSEVNKTDEDRLYASIQTEDGKIHTLDYINFLNEAERKKFKIKKIDKKQADINHGEFLTQNTNPKDEKNFQQVEIEDIEVRTDDDYTLEIPDGERKGELVKLNHLALNL
jgi:hypothetical protein